MPSRTEGGRSWYVANQKAVIWVTVKSSFLPPEITCFLMSLPKKTWHGLWFGVSLGQNTTVDPKQQVD